MIDLCQWFGKVMKKIYTYQIFLCFLMASVIRALIMLCFNNLTELSLLKCAYNEKNASKHLALRASLLACIDIEL